MTKEEAFSVRNYSVEANFQALENLIKDNPDLWSDKYLLGTGSQLLRIISAGQSANGVRTLQALYESLIGFMQRRDSILGFGETMGYSAFRGSNDIISIRIAEANQSVIIPARTVVGNVKGIDLVTLDVVTMTKGKPVTFNVKVGNLKKEVRSIVDTSYRYIRFLGKNISDDVLFYIGTNGSTDDTQVDYITQFKDAYSSLGDTSTVYVMLTNAYESVDIFILDRGEDITIDSSTKYTISYIEYTDINYVATDIHCDFGTIVNPEQGDIKLIKSGEPPQSVESLRACIPYFRDTQREVLANRDPIKILRLLMPNVENTSGTNLNTVHSLLSYKYSDKHLATNEELLDYESELAPTYYFGFCPSNIFHPIQYNTDLTAEIVTFGLVDETIDIGAILEDILKTYELLPETRSVGILPINLNDIESEINKYKVNGEPIIKTAYINFKADTFSSSNYLSLGKIYTSNNTDYYRLKDFKYESGNTLPSPSDFDTEEYVACGDIILQKWRPIYGYIPLEANTYYKADDIVGLSDSDIYRVHPNYILSGTEPEWNPEKGSITQWWDMLWLAIDYVPGTLYPDTSENPQGVPEGANALKGMIITPVDSEVSYQLIGFTKQVNSLSSPELVLETLSNGLKTRELFNVWNSYTIFSIGEEDLNVHP